PRHREAPSTRPLRGGAPAPEGRTRRTGTGRALARLRFLVFGSLQSALRVFPNRIKAASRSLSGSSGAGEGAGTREKESHVVSEANFRKRLLAMIAALDRLAPLVVVEFRASAHFQALPLAAFSAFAGA